MTPLEIYILAHVYTVVGVILAMGIWGFIKGSDDDGTR